LLVDLVSSLHSDSLLFSWQKKTTSVIMTAVESRYFLRINGHPLIVESFKEFGVESSSHVAGSPK